MACFVAVNIAGDFFESLRLLSQVLSGLSTLLSPNAREPAAASGVPGGLACNDVD